MNHEIILAGANPSPLASYLKGLGAFRLVAAQADPGALACWRNENMLLKTSLARDELEAFFLEKYRPTPVFAPWNGGSGFYPKDNKSGISTIKNSRSPRFEKYGRIIAEIQRAMSEENLEKKPEKDGKTGFIDMLRSTLPDEALEWLDSSVLLTGEELKFPPLLGTGGNDGRLDFTNNFMQYLAMLFDPASGSHKPEAEPLLRACLFDEPCDCLKHGKAIGQFFPGASGGPNSTTGFESDSLTNPWDFVLMLEGAILFAAAATRRLEASGHAALSYPFTVAPTGGGHGACHIADETPARAEIWLPLWSRPSCLAEVRALFSEARVTLGRRPVKDGLDFVRAVTSLGIDRGIASFQRYGLFQRSGKAYLATPLNRVAVRQSASEKLVRELERNDWLSRFRRFARGKNTPGRFVSLARVLENRIFELARASSAKRLEALLVHLGKIQQALGKIAAEDLPIRPVPRLSEKWIAKSDDASPEFRVAAALASLGGSRFPMGVHLAPISLDGKKWKPESKLCAWSGGPLVENLNRVALLRFRVARKEESAKKPTDGRFEADLGSISLFLGGRTDDRRIADLLAGMVLARPAARLPELKPDAVYLPLAYLLSRLLFEPDERLSAMGILPADGSLPIPSEFCRNLQAGKETKAMEILARRLNASGVAWKQDDFACTSSAPRLLAALLVPPDRDQTAAMLRRMFPETRRASEK